MQYMEMKELLRIKLKTIRRELKLTQSDLAGLLGVIQVTVARWESGVSPIGVDTIEKLAKICQKPVPWFFTFTHEDYLASAANDQDLTELIKAFHSLNAGGKERALDYLHLLALKYSKSASANPDSLRVPEAQNTVSPPNES